jgi:hypothetical protein
MALTNLEKIKVLRHLGWPAKTTDPTSLSYSKIASDKLINLSDEILSEVRYFLERIEKLDSRLDGALDRAGVKSIDDIELNGDEMTILRSEKRKLVKELATLLDLAILSSGSSMGSVVV